jgi:hypothetical protein
VTDGMAVRLSRDAQNPQGEEEEGKEGLTSEGKCESNRKRPGEWSEL